MPGMGQALGPQVACVVESLLERPTQYGLRQARGVRRLTDGMVRTSWKPSRVGSRPLTIPPTAPSGGFWRRDWSEDFPSR